MIEEPALRFWLAAVERRGALREDRGDESLLILPRELQAKLALPEEVVVTADPEAASEDGALLIIPGHPLVDQAVDDVLRGGDAGHRVLAWPKTQPPAAADLLAKARAALPVAHGRVDAAGAPVPSYLPLVRVGALVRYALGEHFQEREEVLVDAVSARELPEGVQGRLYAAPLLDALPESADDHPCLAPDLIGALEAVEAVLNDRVGRREAVLRRSVEGDRKREVDQANAYYADVLAATARRRETAAPERQALLDAQAEGTRVEQSRRLAEIEEKFRPRHEIEPFRLHLLLVPCLSLPLVVRRGERSYPFATAWLLDARAFAPVRCPACGAAATLVAGRDSLGCESCQPSAQPPWPRAAPLAAGSRASGTAVGAPARAPAPAPASAPVPVAARPPLPANPPAIARRPPAAARAEAQGRRASEPIASEPALTAPDYGKMADRVLRVAQRVAVAVWEDPAWVHRHTATGSPLSALRRLYGSVGVQVAVGLPADRPPVRVGAMTSYPDPLGRTDTSGELFLDARAAKGYHFAILWRLQGRDPVLSEVLPFEVPVLQRMATADLPSAVRERLTVRVPRPRAELDPLAATLWQMCLPVEGLPLVVRCLSLWWAAGGWPDGSPGEAELRVRAAALADAVARQAGLRRAQAATAQTYGLDPKQLVAAARPVRSMIAAARRQA